MKTRFSTLTAFICWVALSHVVSAGQWVTYEGKEGPGKGKQIVLLAGDEEYRSEEALPQLGKILSQRHGFKCTVLFSQDDDGTINPRNQTNVPGMQNLDGADLVIIDFRFRELPDADMKHFVDYLQGGKPIIALRTATHAFNYTRDKSGPYAKWSYNNGGSWPGGFGQQVLGETWINHWGGHGRESTRGLIDGLNSRNPILRGVKDIWGNTDVYEARHLGPSDKVLVHGLILKGMKPDDPPSLEKALMPIVWTHEYKWENGNTTRSLTSTIGSSTDLLSEDLRRLLVNAAYSLLDLTIPAKSDVEIVGDYAPTMFKDRGHKQGVKPADHELKN